MKTPSAGNILSLNLFAYEDTYYSDLLANWQIDINCLLGLDLTVKMGELIGTKLTAFGDQPRICKLYSSTPLLAYFPAKYSQAITLVAG